jgi:transcription termination factor NusA
VSEGLLAMNDLLTQVSAKLPHNPHGKDRRREFAVRAVEQLRGKGLVAITNGFVSITGVATAEEFSALEKEPLPATELRVEPEKPKPRKAKKSKPQKTEPPVKVAEPGKASDTTEDTAWLELQPKKAEAKSKTESLTLREMFMQQLDVDADVADILIREKFTTLEEVTAITKLTGIKEFDEEIANELQIRAAHVTRPEVSP